MVKSMVKRILIVYALAATAAAWIAGRWAAAEHGESQRLAANARVLGDSVLHYRTRLGESAASVEALELRCSEFRRLHAEDARRIRELGLRLRRVESTAAVSTRTETDVGAVLHDTVVVHDTVQMFGWSDGWVTVEGRIAGREVECRVESVDTLRQVVHRVPRRFLFIRWGTKAVRQEVVSSNPHTQIVCTEYIELTGRRRRNR